MKFRSNATFRLWNMAGKEIFPRNGMIVEAPFYCQKIGEGGIEETSINHLISSEQNLDDMGKNHGNYLIINPIKSS